MKIKDVLKPNNISRIKQDDDPYCSICGKLKTKHSDDQRDNCIQARYRKA